MASSTGASAAFSSLEAAGTGLAAGPVGAIIAGGTALIGSLLQHSARLTGATDENDAAKQAVPAFDDDLQSIAQGFDAGTLSQAQAITAIQQLQQNIYAFFIAQVGKPGTAWTPGGGGACNKNCTVGCCLYYADMVPALNAAISVVQAGGGTVKVPTINGDKYGLQTRPGYTLTFQPAIPAIGSTLNSVTAAITGAVGAITGQSTTATAASATAASSSSSMLLLAFAAIAIVAVIFLTRKTV